MKKVLIFAFLFLSFGFGSCQCADPPDVGPVEDQGQAAMVDVTVSPTDAIMA